MIHRTIADLPARRSATMAPIQTNRPQAKGTFARLCGLDLLMPMTLRSQPAHTHVTDIVADSAESMGDAVTESKNTFMPHRLSIPSMGSAPARAGDEMNMQKSKRWSHLGSNGSNGSGVKSRPKQLAEVIR